MVPSSDNGLNDAYRALCMGVGHLFINFGRWEGALSAMLRLHLAEAAGSSMGDKVAISLSSAIYGSMRYKAARDTINRINVVEALDGASSIFLEGVFAQAGHIEGLRDKLAHQAIVPSIDAEHGYWQVSDQTVTRDLKKVKIYTFDVEAVIAAANDLNIATDRLGNRAASPKLFGELSTEPIAWQYKPSMLRHVQIGRARTRQ